MEELSSSHNHDTSLFLDRISKTYGEGETRVEAVKNITLEFQRGESILILGPSGSGKTTLLSMIGGLLKPTSGKIFLHGRELSSLQESKLSPYRLKYFGFIFQEFNLLSTLSAIENIELVIHLAGLKKDLARQKAKSLLEVAGLSNRAHHYPSQLSGGEKQRIAIMRALANNPPIVLADEPTGNLDTEIGNVITQILSGIACSANSTVVMVSHDERIKKVVDRILYVQDGRITREEKGGHDRTAKESHNHFLTY